MPAGTVHVRVANCAEVVGVVGAVANVTMHAPSDASVDVTPVALSTVVVHAPVPTEAARTEEAGKLTEIPPSISRQAMTVRRNMDTK